MQAKDLSHLALWPCCAVQAKDLIDLIFNTVSHQSNNSMAMLTIIQAIFLPVGAHTPGLAGTQTPPPRTAMSLPHASALCSALDVWLSRSPTQAPPPPQTSSCACAGHLPGACTARAHTYKSWPQSCAFAGHLPGRRVRHQLHALSRDSLSIGYRLLLVPLHRHHHPVPDPPAPLGHV